jgi:hypothetical protein
MNNKDKNTKNQITAVNFYERVPKMVQGYFKITQKDRKGNILYEYEDKNKIMVWTHKMFGELIYGYEPPPPEDFFIHCVALGTDGIEESGAPKEITADRTRLFSEEKFWNLDLYPENKAYVYQATWGKPTTNDYGYITKLNEGANFPHDEGRPIYYRDEPFNDPYTYVGLKVQRGYADGILTQDFVLEIFSGNAHPIWDVGPRFSEAALYSAAGAREDGKSLGTMFSMKTFPEMIKSEDCIIEINWTLDFNF